MRSLLRWFFAGIVVSLVLSSAAFAQTSAKSEEQVAKERCRLGWPAWERYIGNCAPDTRAGGPCTQA